MSRRSCCCPKPAYSSGVAAGSVLGPIFVIIVVLVIVYAIIVTIINFMVGIYRYLIKSATDLMHQDPILAILIFLMLFLGFIYLYNCRQK
jgi:uncharacterized BrkB/YihY/UPF0761 family membrane protein